VGNRTIFANCGTLAGHVEVGDDAAIGAFSAVHQFCRVGRHAYIGGYTRMVLDALPFQKIVGIRAANYGLNRIGLRRKGFDVATLRALESAMTILLRSGLNTTQALVRLRAEHGEDSEVQYLIAFVESSQRGVLRALPKGRGTGEGDGEA
jgi:UDP-N-acetylglucosamine acyltransferase